MMFSVGALKRHLPMQHNSDSSIAHQTQEKGSRGKENYAWWGDKERHSVYIISISEMACNILVHHFRGL
jgi:hypothetical protein